MAERPSVLSLFSGAGGLDYGLEAAGFKTHVVVEMDARCCETLHANGDWHVIGRSIFDVPTEEMLSKGGLARQEVDLVAGGPPCQPFSKSSYWKKGDAPRLADPRAQTLDAYMRVAEEALPKAVLLENVVGLAFADKDEGLRHVLSAFDGINARQGTKYKPVTAVINAADYGVPQLRERFFLVAARDGTEFKFPKVTHGDEEGLARVHSAWDALGDLSPEPDEDLALRGKWADLIPTIPEGWNYLFHTPGAGGLPLFGWRRRYWNFLLKLSKRLPSWTIQAQPGPSVGPFHWDNRRLSRRELCRLQTFPDSVEIQGDRMAVQRQVGNAVPSLLAEVLGREIRAQLLGLPRLKGRLVLEPPYRTPVPRARARLTQVPQQYLSLVGDHEPHPGTGKGKGALERAAAAKAA